MQPFAESAAQLCPYCGEEVEVAVDPIGVASETYIEDCPVCCRPWTVQVSRDEESFAVHLRRDDD
ncbi:MULTISPECIES: CPXCG motif-containing cysteine-rich protein [Myxococcus]|uniref:CPXCG motif-containing cysteine-rich protein n=1 Tax=Myxococcus TaxID=32 RepID=UPI00112DE4CB|nr:MULTISPECIES: CPXCG motif-containing cysteine-rich protein [Myxococcus]NOK06816.1 CPXCG motif-containing cysteine-rich protein [Myxococcus xanthus]QDE88412.1 CPXCG motif-containing cysteine-rich protein [Myxococcus xanthus]